MKKYKNFLLIGFILLSLFVTLCFIPINATRLIPVIENQINEELGVKVHIERLVLRIGPYIKLKAPIVHVLYEDGQKFAQIDNAKFYVSVFSLIKNNPRVAILQAKKLTIRLASDDKYLSNLLDKIQNKEFKQTPNIHLKEYDFSYLDKNSGEKYLLEGSLLNLDKLPAYKNYKLKTNGSLGINSYKYITYDLVLVPNMEIKKYSIKTNLTEYLKQIKELDFHSDIIADIKMYMNQEKALQASGFINIDNISVLDKTKKNPKSFVYLTLWGDKASILSNIYTSLNKKVYVEGMVKNTQKPVLDIKVRTDEIEIKDLYQKLKIFLDFSCLKNINSVTGTLNANFSFKGDLKKIKSNGYIKIIDAAVQADTLQINKINSEIDFSNNAINIIKAVGFVNNAPIIAKGQINKNVDIEVLMNKVELKHLCPSKWGVKSGIISLISNLSGTLDNIIHKEKISVENLVSYNNNCEISLNSFKIDTNKSNIAYANNIIIKTQETEDIKIPSLKVILDKDQIKFPEAKIFMPNSMVTLKADIFNISNTPNFVTNLDGFINSKDIKRFINSSTRFPIKLNINGNKDIQNLNTQVLFEKTDILDEPAILNLNSKLENGNLKIEDLSLVSYTGKFDNDLKNNLKGNKKIVITGLLENLKKPIMKNIRLFIPQQLNLNYLNTVIQVKGDLFINGEFIKPEIIGQLLLQNLFSQHLQMSLNNCCIDFNKNNIIINAPLLKIADTSVSLNALVSTDVSKAINVKNINIKSKYLNTDTILMYKDSPILKSYPILINDGKFYAEKLLMNLYGNPLYLSALTTEFNLVDKMLKFKNLSGEIYNGKLSGSLDYNLRDENFDSKFMARGVSAEPIFNIVTSRKDSISGNMNFDSELKGELISKQSLNGNIKFVISNGRMSTLGKLEHLLYAQNVIADNMLRTSLSVVTKAITLKDTGLFKELRGDIDLSEGLAKIKLLQSQGPLMSLFIKGQYNILNDYATLFVLGRLSDEIITGLGAFGDFSFNKLMIMLTGEEKKQALIIEDFDKIPQLPVKNTKEFSSIINGYIDKPSSVKAFNWISYSEKSLKQKEVPDSNVKIPDFVEALPY